MDPLSITASIIAVLQAANAIITVCYDCKSLIKGTPWALTQTITGLQDLRLVLEALDRLAEEEDVQPSSRKNMRSLELLCDFENGPLATCRRELEYLGEVIGLESSGASISKRKALLRAVQWQFKEKDVKQCLERIERCKSTLALAITADEVALLRNIQAMGYTAASDLNNMSTDLDNFVQTVQDKEVIAKRRNITEWLSPVDPSESHDTALEAHQPGTNNWFVECEEFKGWLESTCSFLWVSGFPGAGKTTMFGNTITHLRDRRPKWYLAYFYCDFRSDEAQDIVNIIGSLAAQICSQCGSFPEELEEAYDQSMSRPGQKKRPTLSLLNTVLETISERYDIVLLLDALDECRQMREACEFLIKLQESCRNIRVLVTSRDNVDIHARLSSCPRVQLERHMDEVNGDVNSYISHRLYTDIQLQWLSDAVKEDIAARLTEKSEGMFRWVQCQIDAIEKLRTVKAIRAALQTLPKGLNKTYANILSNVEESDIDLVRRILLWVSFTVFPVTLSETYQAIAIEPNVDQLDEESLLARPQDILDLCGSLVSVSEQGHLRLAHLSVKEFLLGPELEKEEALAAFSLNANNANHELAVNCLSYLSFKELASGPCGTFNAYAERISRYPLLSYAALSWTYFVRETTLTLELRTLVFNFFSAANRATFMSWVQVLNAVHGTRKWDFYPRHATPLYYAASFGLLEIVEDIIRDPEVKLNAPGSRFGGTALHAAVLRAHYPVMKTLLDAGADPSQGDFQRVTPLHSAASYGYEEAVKMLLAYGVSVDILTEIDMSPIDVAQLNGHESIVKLFLASGASTNTLTEIDMPPIDMAKVNSHECEAKLLSDPIKVSPASRVSSWSSTGCDSQHDPQRAFRPSTRHIRGGRGHSARYTAAVHALRSRLPNTQHPQPPP